MSMLTADLTLIFADTTLTVPVVFGAQSCRGFLTTEDTPVIDDMGGTIIASRRVVVIPDNALTGLLNESAITVNGISCRVHGSPRQHGIGKVRLVLA